MDYRSILQDLKNKVYHPVYFLTGDEAYYIDLIADYIESTVLEATEKDFNQSILNEIVLWKVNRYALFDDETLMLLNSIKKTDTSFEVNNVRELLIMLLNTKGVRLPMASTILRFKNPDLFQIIDQRVYRILYGKEFEISTYISDASIEKQVSLYFTYLNDLKEKCQEYKIPFSLSDRILFMADKDVNKGIKIKY